MKRSLLVLLVLLIGCMPMSQKRSASKSEPVATLASDSDSANVASVREDDVVTSANVRPSRAEELEYSPTSVTVDPTVTSPQILPPPPPPPPPPSGPRHVAKKAKKLNGGLLVYDIPDTLKFRTWYTVRFRINRDTEDTVTIVSKLQNVTVHGIRVSGVMMVKVTDPHSAFEIVKSNDDTQIVDTTEYTEWVYNIRPLKSGKHPLHIVISVVQTTGKKELVYINDVFVKTEMVAVVQYNLGTFFGKYWQWLISTLILPFGIWFWNNRRKKKKKEE